ncbi:hypothetical protein QNJ95_37330 [Bradyrhizobium elkanii]|uniref:P-loop ATPase, Sll1717 family n=1 Tax=Bradyrhizobium elkanii TaxID=29448 RepID=UPI002712040F|nr:hypothetical protein [Bradyrhizobium elkanii]WLA38542.1 hypothetical protein QNJ95_37330 [Bradyrhizobium elkanii]
MEWKAIKSIRCGYADAQNYKNGQESGHFEASFLTDRHLEQLKARDVFFLIGEKGTGKTAYAIYLTYFSKGKYNSDITFVQPTDYTDLLSLSKDAKLSVADYSALWQIAFLTTLYRNCVVNCVSEDLRDHSITKINDIISKFTFATGAIRLADVFAILKNVDEFCIALNKLSKHGEDFSFSNAPVRAKINFLRQQFLEALANLPAKLQFTLFVDGIDIRPDYLEFDSFIECVSGLCDAVWILNSSHLNLVADRSFKIVLLVRPDILSNAGLQNPNLKTRDNSLLLSWIADYKVYRNCSLFQMTDKLLAGQQAELVKLPGEAWDHYFPFGIENRVKGDLSDNPFINFLRHSFYKPRDILLYLETMKNRWIETGSGDDDCFTFQVFRDRSIRKQYSDYLLGEVRDSLAFYYRVEEFEIFLRFFAFLGEHVDKRHREFSYDAFVQAYSDLLRYADKNKIDLPVLFRTADILLQFLYELNILCFRINPARSKYPQTRWCFRERSFANIRPKVKSGCTYGLHYGIARGLYDDIQ